MNIDVGGLEIDTDRTGPLAQYGSMWRGQLGSFWTRPTLVRLEDLRGLGATAISRERLRSVRAALHASALLPPIEIAITANGQRGWLIDGNHRLVAARRRRDRAIEAIFTVIGR